MTARSPHQGIVELDPALYRRANDPMCAARVRDGVVNGLLHKADSVAQVRINWQPVNEDLTVTGSPVRYAAGDFGVMGQTAAGAWYSIQPQSFGVIDVPIHASGELYEFRLRTAWGAGDNAYASPPPSATVTVRVFLYPDSDPAAGPANISGYHGQAEDYVWEGTFEATTVGHAGAWITGATRGPGAYATKLVLDPSVVRDWPRWPPTGARTAGRMDIDAPNDVDGGSLAPTTVLRCNVGVAASVDLDPSGSEPQVIPLMRALHLQGFVGEAA